MLALGIASETETQLPGPQIAQYNQNKPDHNRDNDERGEGWQDTLPFNFVGDQTRYDIAYGIYFYIKNMSSYHQ